MSNLILFPGAGGGAPLVHRDLVDGVIGAAALIGAAGGVAHANAAWRQIATCDGAYSAAVVLRDVGGAELQLDASVELSEARATLDLADGAAVTFPVAVTSLGDGSWYLVRRVGSAPQADAGADPNAEVAWLLFDQAFEPAFTWLHSEPRVISAWNAAAERLYGIPRAAAVGQDPRVLLQTRGVSESMDEVDRALARDGQWRGELLQNTASGHELAVETVMKLVVLPDGRQIVLETSRDVSLERKSQRAARESQMRLSLALSANKTGIWERDLETGEAYWSPEAYAILGVDPAAFQVSVDAFAELLHPEDAPKVWAEVDRVMAGAMGFDCSFRVIRPDGVERWLHNCAVVVPDEHGSPRRLVGTVRDTTEERSLADQLAESEARHRQLANAMPQIVWTCRADGSVDWLNDQWYEYTGATESPAQHSPQPYVHPEDAERVTATWSRALQQGSQWEAEYRLKDRAGDYRWHLGRMVPLRNAAGNVVRLVATATNIEEHKHAEQSLREADRRKDEFLAMLSHELRNPLAPILTALQLMTLRGVEQGVEEREVIERQAKHMMRLVDDLLDVSRVAQGKIELHKQLVDLSTVVTKALEITAPLLEKKHHDLSVDVPSHLFLEGDEDRLVQVVSNLLTNAGRYTPPRGKISVVGVRQDEEVVLQVLDNGIGMPEELIPHVFETFVQGPRRIDRSEGGLGLGLALVASLTALHGGSVTAHSAGRDLGSEFVLRFPLATASARPVPPEAPLRGSRVGPLRKILVVDDNEDAALLLASALRSAGHEVRAVFDPVDALSTLDVFQPDFAILDIGLPVMDGYQLGRALRERLGPALTLYALSGYAQDKDRQMSRDAGFDLHFVKPMNVRLLLEHIAGSTSEAERPQ